MFLDCKTKFRPAKWRWCIFFVMYTVFTSIQAGAQNVSSPYSILGIGDIDTKSADRYFISGSTALARRLPWAYNVSNPASLTALPLKTMHLDILMRGKTSTFSFPNDDTATSPNKDFIIRRISMAFKVTEKMGIAFGLQPYSTVNYKLSQNRVRLDDNTYYEKAVEGSGGINQVYLSMGHALGKKVSVGLTGSYLFGSLQQNTQYFNSYMDITRTQIDFYYGAVVQGTLQYYSLPGKNWQHTVGVSGSVGTNLKGELKTEYTENTNLISKTVETGASFDLPISAGIGYSGTNRAGITLSVEGGYSKWNYQKVKYSNSYSYPTYKAGVGLEYSIKNVQNRASEKGFFGIGLHAENSYLRIDKQKLWDYSMSLGGGLNIFRNLSLYSGVELGRKGNKASNQIRENYTQFVVGITLKDIWIGTKKYGRYAD